MRIHNDSAAYMALQQLQQPLVRTPPAEGASAAGQSAPAAPPRTVPSAGIASQNVLAASPRIDAADTAAGVVAGLASRIAADAGDAVEAQANQSPASVLRLISGNQG